MMPTTIDSLQIEIQSNSSNAAQGIHELAVSLGALKANGTISTAIKNLNHLSEKLRYFTDASNTTTSIGRLAESMQKLKAVGSITSIANSVGNMNTALRGVESVNVDAVGVKLERIATAVAPLSAVKAGGLNTMIRGLTKLSDVTKSLDDDTIEQFAQRVDLVSQKLGPLSEKMTTIKAGFSAINSSARKASSGTAQFRKGINVSALNVSSFINILQAAVHAIQKVIDKFREFINDASEWEGISARFGRGFGPYAQEAYEWIRKLNQELGINVQQFMQYSSIYATMLKGFGVGQADAAKMARGYTELTYDIWAGYNDIYKRFSDAADAIKSAIAGEVEPVRKAGFTIIESTLEQTAANHGLKISLEKATEAQKSYLRYLTLVDQAYSQNLVGSYAKELNTAEGLMRTFAQQTKTLAQTFGSLLLPVLTTLMPYLQRAATLMTELIRSVAGLFGIKIQEVDWSGYNAGAGAAVDNTNDLTNSIKEAKGQLLGIDELNVLSPPDTDALAGTASFDIGIELPEYEFLQEAEDSAKQNIDHLLRQLRAAIEEGDWFSAGALLARKLNEAMNMWDAYGAGYSLGSAIRGAISLAYGMLSTFDFTQFGAKVAGFLNGSLSAINWDSLGRVIAGGVTAAFDFAIGFITTFDWGEAVQSICETFVGFFDGLSYWITTVEWDILAVSIWQQFKAAIEGIDFGAIARSFFTFLGAAFAASLEFLLTAFLTITSDISAYFHTKMEEAGGNAWEGFKKGIVDAITGVGHWIETNIFEPFMTGIKTVFGIHSPSTVMAEIGGFLVEGLLNGITEKWELLKEWFNTNVAPKLTKDYWKDAFAGIADGLKEAIRGGINRAVDLLNSFINWANRALHIEFPGLANPLTGGWIIPPMSIQLATIPNIPYFADGGFPEEGQMFIARERGPELVGSIGQKTAVANNDQIVEGITAGVYQAVVAAMETASDSANQNINVYLDGKQIHASVKKRESERGMQLIGDQLGFSY